MAKGVHAHTCAICSVESPPCWGHILAAHKLPKGWTHYEGQLYCPMHDQRAGQPDRRG